MKWTNKPTWRTHCCHVKQASFEDERANSKDGQGNLEGRRITPCYLYFSCTWFKSFLPKWKGPTANMEPLSKPGSDRVVDRIGLAISLKFPLKMVMWHPPDRGWWRDKYVWCIQSSVTNLGCVRLGNPDFGFCNRTRNPKTDFTSEKSVLRVDFQIRISWSSVLPFDWEIRKRICKTILVNIGFLFTNYACACKTAVLKDSFPNRFSDFPIEQ